MLSPRRIAALRRLTAGPVPRSASVVSVMPDAPCGFCEHPRASHGTRYSTFGGAHEWVRRWPGSHSTSIHPLPIREENPHV